MLSYSLDRRPNTASSVPFETRGTSLERLNGDMEERRAADWGE